VNAASVGGPAPSAVIAMALFAASQNDAIAPLVAESAGFAFADDMD
jgi:hypothetical protein